MQKGFWESKNYLFSKEKGSFNLGFWLAYIISFTVYSNNRRLPNALI